MQQQQGGDPRPAPNADGWSSGENQFDAAAAAVAMQQQQAGQPSPYVQAQQMGLPPQQRQPQQHFAHGQFSAAQAAHAQAAQQAQQQAAMAAAAQQPSWNVSASEFVPK